MASRKSDKHIAKVAVKAVMRKAETKSFISANQSRSMTDDFFYYQNIFAPIASGSGSENREGEKIAVKNVKINWWVFHIILPLKPLLNNALIVFSTKDSLVLLLYSWPV